MSEEIEDNLEWIRSGKIGCTFASYFARFPEDIGWKFVVNPDSFSIPSGCFMLSLIFSGSNKINVKHWALRNGFFLEDVGEGLIGLRKKFPEGIAWVQYFGFDADVKTRQCPHPMLLMCVKRPAISYARVGFKGILHIAHASIERLSLFVADKLWDTSHSNTEKQLGYKPTIREAAKTTFHE